MKELKRTDIKDSWNEGKLINEGDIVLLYNWGINNNDQVIGIAQVCWDDEYHKWDFVMIAGSYIECEYDRWRQNPRVIGNIIEGITAPEFSGWSIRDTDRWKNYIKQQQHNADLTYQKQRLNRLITNKKKVLKEKTSEIIEIEESIKEIKENLEKLKK